MLPIHCPLFQILKNSFLSCDENCSPRFWLWIQSYIFYKTYYSKKKFPKYWNCIFFVRSCTTILLSCSKGIGTKLAVFTWLLILLNLLDSQLSQYKLCMMQGQVCLINRDVFLFLYQMGHLISCSLTSLICIDKFITGQFSERFLQNTCWKSFYMKISIFPRGALFFCFQTWPMFHVIFKK